MKKRILSSVLGLVLLTAGNSSLAMSPMSMPNYGATPSASSTSSPFTDVKVNDYSAEAIAYMKFYNIVQGYSDGTFRADNSINRAEFLKIVLEATSGFEKSSGEDCVTKRKTAGSKSAYLSDVATDSWYAPYVCYGVENKIIAGYADGTYQPGKNINVAEMAKIVSKTQGLSLAPNTTTEWYAPYFKALETKSAIPANIKEVSSDVTRGNMAEVVYRIVAKRDDKPAQTFDELKGIPKPLPASGTLGTIGSCSELGKVMYDASYNDGYSGGPIMYDMAMPMSTTTGAPSKEATAPTADGMAGGTSAETDYSTTNVQVAGVDESDVVKNDGRYIYVLKNFNGSNTLKIVDTTSGATMKEVANMTLDNKEGFQPTEMYVAGDKLVVTGTSYRYDDTTIDPTYNNMPYLKYYGGAIMRPYYWGTSYADFKVIDISDKTNPKLTRSVSIEGYLSNTRRIGDNVYFVLSRTPEYYVLNEPGHRTEELLPTITDSASGNVTKPLGSCAGVRYFPGYEKPEYLIVGALSISDSIKPVSSEVILGSVDTIYMSPSNLYVATGYVAKGEYQWNWNNTQLYKFALDNQNVTLKGSAVVEGRVLNQFSMDEHKDHFRIATHVDKNWTTNVDEDNRVFVLDSNMKMTGALKGLGKGEALKSARFMGDRAFMVTFKSIDPFYVLNMTDPANPSISGLLKIPGYSDYLQPYDENHIVGFGKDVTVQKDANGNIIEPEFIPWDSMKGFKLSYFDVTDLANPKEMSTVVLGDRGSESQVAYEHKALLMNKDKNLIAFPIKIMTKVGTHVTKDCTIRDGVEKCTDSYTYDDIVPTFEGAMVYGVDPVKGLVERARIGHFDAGQDFSNIPWEEEIGKQIQRLLYIGTNLYSVSWDKIKENDLTSLTELRSLSLSK